MSSSYGEGGRWCGGVDDGERNAVDSGGAGGVDKAEAYGIEPEHLSGETEKYRGGLDIWDGRV